MKTLKKLALAGAFAAAFASGVNAAPAISVTAAQQRYPWNNIVDVTYTLTGAGTDPATYAVVLTTTINGTEVELSNGCEPSTNGTFTVQCVLPSDLQATNCKVTGKIYTMASCTPTVGSVSADNDYCIVDLVNGGETFEKKLDYQALSNRRYKATEYMTTKMVFRKIPAGTYKYYNGGWNAGTPATSITIGDYYWVAIYPCTKAQFYRLGGKYGKNGSETASTSADENKIEVAWNVNYRHVSATVAPAINGKVGRSGTSPFFLPGEGQWEVAARAGTTTKYHWGDNWDETMGTTTMKGNIARFVPNAWGIYDMNGTVIEWTSTRGPLDGIVYRSGTGNHGLTAVYACSSFRDYTNILGVGSYSDNYGHTSYYGFRLARVAQ